MKRTIIILAFGFFIMPNILKSQCPVTFHDFSALDIHGNNLLMSSFAGKKVLVVNTASYCGYTYQYGQLQTLYDTYGGSLNPYNFEIIGFPANNFANQEPYGEDSILQLCADYGVTFTMMSKISVKDPGQHVIYQWLTNSSQNCVQNAPVTWNFQKFMINPDGSWHGFVTPATSPLHSTIVNWITGTSSVDETTKGLADQISVYFLQSDKNIIINTGELAEQKLTIRLLSITGQYIGTIYSGIVYPKQELSYSTSYIESGVYMVEIMGESFRKVSKLLTY